MRRARWLMVLALSTCGVTAISAEEPNPRLERYRANLRRAIPRLSSTDRALRVRALSTVRRALHWKGAPSLALSPAEHEALAGGALDVAIHVLTDGTSELADRDASYVIERLCGHHAETARVVAGRIDELGRLFDTVDEDGLDDLMDALGLLGRAADPLAPRVAALLPSEDSGRRAGFALGGMAGPRARSALAGALRDERPEIRRNALHGWRVLPTLAPAEVRMLLEAFEDPGTAALARGTNGDIDATPADAAVLVDEVLDGITSKSEQTRSARLRLLRAFGDSARPRADGVRAVLDDDPDFDVRITAARVLVDIDPGPASARAIMDAIEAAKDADHQYVRCDLLTCLRLLAPHALPLVPRLQAIAGEARARRRDDVLTAARRALRRIAATTRLVSRTTFQAGEDRVRSLAWSPTGETVAAGCADRTLRLFHPDRAEPIAARVLPRYG